MKNDPITLGSLGVSYCPSTTVYLWPRAPAPLSSCSTPRLSHLLGDVAIAGLAEASKAMKQSAMDKLTELTIPQIILGETEKPIFETVNLQQEVVLEILQKSATSSAVERLRKNPALAAWVEGGRELHAHSEDGKCEYCLQIIPEEREAELAAHFNASDAKLKREIERAIGDNKAAYEKVARMSGLSEKALYPEFRTDFLIYSGLLSEEQTKILNHLEALRKALEDKLAKRTESYNAEFPSLSGNDWHEALSSLNDLFRCHNAETDDFQKRLDDNFAKIETHFLSAADHEVKNVKSSIKAVAGQISICTKGDSKTKALGIDDLEIRIETNRAKISNTQQAATALSQKLAAFLGRDDLKFVPEGAGYRIMRFGRAAKRLSEGEKTAITFLYFIVGLGDQDFDLREGIVVIDDPISSLDSSSVYQAFSYLKNAVKDAKQVFLLTHNFEFLKLLLDWFSHGNQSDKSYWMLHCSNTGVGVRETELKPLDKVLTENRNELIFLFRTLVNFKSDGTIANSYPIPNIVRKVLESFLDQHSSGKTLYKKLNNLEYDEQIKESLYKYTNDLSHSTLSGLDPALVGATETNVKHLHEMIKAVAPVHYDALTVTIGT